MIFRLAFGGVITVVGLGIFGHGLATGETAPTVGGALIAFVGIALAIGRTR